MEREEENVSETKLRQEGLMVSCVFNIVGRMLAGDC